MSQPARVQDLTVLGVKDAMAECRACRRASKLQLADFPPETVFVSIKKRLRCAGCGSKDVDLMPDWRPVQKGYVARSSN